MWGILLVGLLIEAWELLTEVLPLLLAAAGLYVALRWLLVPLAYARASEVRDRLRHQRARRELDWIALQASRAMYEAALARSNPVTGGSAESESR